MVKPIKQTTPSDSDRFDNPWLHYGLLAAIYGVGLITVLFHLFGYGHTSPSSADHKTSQH